MTELAQAVLPLIRSGRQLHRWTVADAHGAQMHLAVAILQEAAEREDPAVVFSVTQRAIASALSVIMRADDSSGIIGAACRDLLDLHAQVAPLARPPVGRLVDWMIKFQFDNKCDFFTLDPIAYAPALGEIGMASYRKKLAEIEARLGPRPSEAERWTSPHSMEWFTLNWNAQRLAILDHDIDAIIRTHARDRSVAAWFEDTAHAFEEINEIDLAIDWAKQATEFDHGHQSLKAAGYWCRLLAEHRPADLVDARIMVFRRWPSSTTAGQLHQDAGKEWPKYRDEVASRLATRPRDAVLFALLSLKDVEYAWGLAHSLGLEDNDVWERLAKAYEKVDAVAVLPIFRRLVEAELVEASAQHYRTAARWLARMRKLAAGSPEALEVDDYVIDLRVTHQRRPRLQQEFDRAGLPPVVPRSS